VTPLVLFFSSEKCKDTGMIINAGMGYFNRAAFVTGPGKAVGDGSRIPTLEEIHESWAAINDLSGGREFPNVTASMMPIIEAFSPKKAEGGAGGGTGGGLTVKSIFDGIPKAFQPGAAAGVDVVFQFDISGAGGGSWHVTVKDGACRVAEGSHSGPTTTIQMGDGDFVKMISGELNAMSAFTGGKLKIAGDVMKSQLIEKLFKF
jgi:putative sterol carrier protein